MHIYMDMQFLVPTARDWKHTTASQNKSLNQPSSLYITTTCLPPVSNEKEKKKNFSVLCHVTFCFSCIFHFLFIFFIFQLGFWVFRTFPLPPPWCLSLLDLLTFYSKLLFFFYAIFNFTLQLFCYNYFYYLLAITK